MTDLTLPAPVLARRGPLLGIAWRKWALILLFWTSLGVLEAANAYVGERLRGLPVTWPFVLEANLPWWWIWALITPLVFFLARAFPLSGPGLWRAAAFHFFAGVLVAVGHLVAEGAVYWLTTSRELRGISLERQITDFLGGYLVVNVMAYWAVVGAHTAFDYHGRLRQRELAEARLSARAAQLEASVTEARLNALRMELNPHFLFNALNSISGLVRRRENEAAVVMLATLGDLLRTTLGQKEQEVPLAEELGFLRRYLDVERVRFHDRMAVEVDVPEALLHLSVPSLVLQPLVENAVRHGVAARSGPGRITVRGRREADALVLEVMDTGPGFDGRGRPEGVGLANTRERLARLYGGRASLELENPPGGGARVVVTIPVREDGDVG